MTNNLNDYLDEEVRLTIEKMLEFVEVSGCIVRIMQKPVNENVCKKTIATCGLGSEFSKALDEINIAAIVKERGAQHFDLLARDDSAKVFPYERTLETCGKNFSSLCQSTWVVSRKAC
jgi:hypothetical protein